MRTKSISLLLLVLLIVACQKSQFGIAHQRLAEIYPNSTSGRTMYSESLIRTATKIGQLDTGNELNQHIRYAFQYRIDTAKPWFKEETDSLIRFAIIEAGMDTYAEYQSRNNKISVYILADGKIIKDAVVIRQDSTYYQFYELVGDMPIDLLFKSGMNNLGTLQNLINFDF